MAWTSLVALLTLPLLAPWSGPGEPAGDRPGDLVRERRPALTQRTLTRLAPEEAPERKVWIYFTDKGLFDEAALAAALDGAAAALDAHESFRRAKVLGPRRVDFHDLPVPEEYVGQVRAAGLEVCRSSRWLNAVSARGSLADLRRVGALPFVRALVPVATHAPSGSAPGGAATGIPRQHIGDLFDYGPSRDQLDEIGVVEVHRLGYSGAGVVVAMLDTGFDWDQPAFAHIVASGRILAQFDFVHGDGETHNEPGDDYGDMDGLTAPITVAADLAVSRGIVVCNAVGNDGTNDWYYMAAPADGFGVVAVGATRADGSLADFSSHGPTFDGRLKPDVAARGDETCCAAPAEWGGGYLWVSGTSVACPLVAGAAALVLEAHPDWTPAEVREALRSTADNAGAPDNDRGWGRIDVLAAIE